MERNLLIIALIISDRNRKGVKSIMFNYLLELQL